MSSLCQAFIQHVARMSDHRLCCTERENPILLCMGFGCFYFDPASVVCCFQNVSGALPEHGENVRELNMI